MMLTYMYINICFFRFTFLYIISPNHFFPLIDITHKDKEMMKQDIRLNLNVKYGNIVPLFNLPSNVKESIVNNNMKKMFDSEVFASDDEYEDNNVPDYDLFNKHVFDIFQQVETIEFAYTIVVSKWNVLGYHFPTIAECLFWRKKWFKDKYLEKTIDDINEDNLFDSNKKRRRNLNADNESFFHNKKKLKVDNENKSIIEKVIGEDEIKIVKIVPSLIIGEIMQEFGVAWVKDIT